MRMSQVKKHQSTHVGVDVDGKGKIVFMSSDDLFIKC